MTYRYTDPDGDSIHVSTDTDSHGQPVVTLTTFVAGHAPLCAHVHLDRVDELVAGIHDTAWHAATITPHQDQSSKETPTP